MTHIEEIESRITAVANGTMSMSEALTSSEARDLIAENKRLREALDMVANSGKFSCHDDAAWDVVNAALTPEPSA